jgi:hypothetical protein
MLERIEGITLTSQLIRRLAGRCTVSSVPDAGLPQIIAKGNFLKLSDRIPDSGDPESLELSCMEMFGGLLAKRAAVRHKQLAVDVRIVRGMGGAPAVGSWETSRR